MNNNWTLTTDIMDKAKTSIEKNKVSIYQPDRKNAVALTRAIRQHYHKASDGAVESIANQALATVAELMGWDLSAGNFIANVRAKM